MNYESRIKGVLISFLFFLLFTLVFSLFPNAVLAQTASPSASSLPATIAPTSAVYTDVLVHNMFHTFSCLVIGSSVLGQPCLTYQITKDAQGAIKSIPVLSQTNLSKGALGATVSMIDLLYTNPPVNTADYIAVLGEDLGIKQANAQVIGSGVEILNPVIRLWQVSRNVAYLMMILVFVIIGLMVMFRQKINPQTVITAQAAIPGLVIGLLLITFSFFLAGLLTDFAFIGTNLVGYYFSAASGGPIQTNLVGEMAKPTGDQTSHNALTIQGRFFEKIEQGQIARAVEIVFNSMGGDAQKWIRIFAGIIGFQLGGSIISGSGTGVIGLILDPVLGAAAGLTFATFPTQIFGLVVYLILLAILIYNMIRLLIRLVNNYLSIIYLTITAPFHFLAASLPGRQGLATNWILNMLCNVLAFPGVVAVFYFVAFVLNMSGPPFSIPTPPVAGTEIIGTKIFPLLGGLDLSFIRMLLAFGAIVAAPAVPEIICRTIGRLGVAGQLIGQEMGTHMGEGRRYYGLAFGGLQSDVGSFGRMGGGFMGSTSFYKEPWMGGNLIRVREPSPFGRFFRGGYPTYKPVGEATKTAGPKTA